MNYCSLNFSLNSSSPAYLLTLHQCTHQFNLQSTTKQCETSRPIMHIFLLTYNQPIMFITSIPSLPTATLVYSCTFLYLKCVLTKHNYLPSHIYHSPSIFTKNFRRESYIIPMFNSPITHNLYSYSLPTLSQ